MDPTRVPDDAEADTPIKTVQYLIRSKTVVLNFVTVKHCLH